MTDYTIVFDGGSQGNGAANSRGYGSYQISAGKRAEIVRLEFPAGTTNNIAEWRSLIAALKDLAARIERAGKSPSAYTVEIKGDSQLVINQAAGNWKVKQPHLRPLRDEAVGLLSRFKSLQLTWQPREESVAVLGH